MAIERRTDAFCEHLGLGWAFAEVLAGDAAHAEAVFREAVFEAREADGTGASPRQRLLAAIHTVHYRGSPRPGGGLGGNGCIAGMSGSLGRAVDALADADRELLFLRFGAELEVADVSRITGLPPAIARARILKLCAALRSRLVHLASFAASAESDSRPVSRVH